MSNDNRKGFTLIEVLIVVVIMAVLAATIIPQFGSSTEEAKESSLSHNLRTMRGQIELYKQDHVGDFPSLANFAMQITSATNSDGGTTGETPYGPYLAEAIPTNPFNDSNAVVGVATPGTKPTAVVAGGAGWQYDESTGGIWPNNSQFYE